MATRVDNLIHKMARQWGVKGHPILDEMELVGEGYLVYAESIAHKHDPNEEKHYPRFVWKLRNRIFDLYKKHRYTQPHKGELLIEVDFSDELVGEYDNINSLFTRLYIEELIDIARKLGKEDVVKLLDTILNIENVEQEVINTAKRKEHLRKYFGKLVKGVDTVQVTLQSVKKYLNWNETKFQDAISQVLNLESKSYIVDSKNFGGVL